VASLVGGTQEEGVLLPDVEEGDLALEHLGHGGGSRWLDLAGHG
jgi:hypothetical protein